MISRARILAPLHRARTVVLFAARVAVGLIFIAHGWDKLTGLQGTTMFFERSGVPAPQFSAALSGVLELGGGIALIAGFMLPVVGTLLATLLLGAMWFVHLDKGLWVRDGGYEYVLALCMAVLMLGFSGGGAFAADRALTRRLIQRRQAATA